MTDQPTIHLVTYDPLQFARCTQADCPYNGELLSRTVMTPGRNICKKCNVRRASQGRARAVLKRQAVLANLQVECEAKGIPLGLPERRALGFARPPRDVPASEPVARCCRDPLCVRAGRLLDPSEFYTSNAPYCRQCLTRQQRERRIRKKDEFDRLMCELAATKHRLNEMLVQAHRNALLDPVKVESPPITPQVESPVVTPQVESPVVTV